MYIVELVNGDDGPSVWYRLRVYDMLHRNFDDSEYIINRVRKRIEFSSKVSYFKYQLMVSSIEDKR
jgi:hypothetical protein